MDACVICLEPLIAAPTRALRCGHAFHAPCIASALAVTAATCPLCRRVVHDNARSALHVRRTPIELLTAPRPAQLLQRLERIDSLIRVLSSRVRATGAAFSPENLQETAREIREIRALLPPPTDRRAPRHPATTTTTTTTTTTRLLVDPLPRAGPGRRRPRQEQADVQPPPPRRSRRLSQVATLVDAEIVGERARLRRGRLGRSMISEAPPRPRQRSTV